MKLSNTVQTVKSTVLIIIALFMGTICFSQDQVANTNTGVLSFKTDEINYGSIPRDADGERTFTFTNTGQAPVIISHVNTSCGCAVPSYSKKPILPGEHGEIKVKYSTNRIGAFTKTFSVISNASEPNKILKIKGEVLKSEVALN